MWVTDATRDSVLEVLNYQLRWVFNAMTYVYGFATSYIILISHVLYR